MTPEGFWERVDQSGECWLWLGGKTGGYGQLRINGKFVMAHRFSYATLVGEIPTGLVLDHLCRTPACVNPEHLQPVTNRVNVQRGLSPLQLKKRFEEQVVCLRGHELSGANVRLFRAKDGHVRRCCRACDRIRHSKDYRLRGVA